MKCLEEVAYYLYVQGILTRMEIKTLIREGFIGYLPEYLWNPLDKQLDDLGVASSDRRRTWEYENWEEDYIARETKIGRELMHVFAARTADGLSDTQGPESTSLRPRVVDVELETLQKHLRGEKNTHGKNFGEVLAVLSGLDQDPSVCGEHIASLPFDRILAHVVDLCSGPSKFWSRAWDFLSYDGFLPPHYSGPIVTAFKQILRGFKKSELGQYDWTLRYDEIEWVYYIVQARMLLLRSFATLMRRRPDFWARKMSTEYHPLAFCAGALVYSAHRNLRAGHLGPDEALPLVFTIPELAHGKAWATAFHMDSNAVMPFLNHYFRYTFERNETFGQCLLKVLYELFDTFHTDVEKLDFIEQVRRELDAALVGDDEGARNEPGICTRQLQALYAHDYFGPLFRGFPPEKEQDLLMAWWQSLSYEVGGYGVIWNFDELAWRKNVIDFEAFLQNESFQQIADPILRLFFGICVPAAWNR